MDAIEDDTGIAINIKEKGLVVIAGCAHSGIINTIKHAQKATGTDKVFVVMGGFHLSGAFFEPHIRPITQLILSQPIVLGEKQYTQWSVKCPRNSF